MPIDLPVRAAPSARRPFELSGRIVLASMIAFFIVVAGVNATMMTMAIRTMPGVDVKSAYETSQRFNSEIARMQEQDARGWQAKADIHRTGADALVALVLHDKQGLPVQGLAVEAKLLHPATRQHDHDATLSETAPGNYAARVPTVHSGGWTVVIEARRDGAPVFLSRSRVVLAD
ncbi:FixH family protein [Bosea sp. (in: a-proteobacteria)]|jgi:nitrogen fixation protein FixH|uniref:FixH family protein n=1 Tax=Bosea sp. (in: a-proteobacteria) TaxID=1871050 RepID=UPI00356431C6